MNQDDIKTNLLDTGQWIRMLFMAGFALAAWLVLLVLIMLVLVQTLIVLVSGEPNRNLRKVGYLFGCYLQEIVQYLCYNSNDKPFPFADFPAAEELADDAGAEQAPAAPFHHHPDAADSRDQSPQ